MDRRRGFRSEHGLIEETESLCISDLRHDLTYNGRARETFIIQDGPFDGARIWIAWKPLRLGHRPWLECPACYKPVSRLFDTQLTCRDCLGLRYASQHTQPHAGQRRQDRQALARVQAIRRRLGDPTGGYIGAGVPRKPRGMHGRTYMRLIAQLEDLETIVLGAARTRASSNLDRIRSVLPPARTQYPSGPAG